MHLKIFCCFLYAAYWKFFFTDMFSSVCDHNKLKTNLRIATERLAHVKKKKEEISKLSRKDIAELLKNKKIDRARIKVEQIIRDDYTIEAMDILETYMELFISRFGLIQDNK